MCTDLEQRTAHARVRDGDFIYGSHNLRICFVALFADELDVGLCVPVDLDVGFSGPADWGHCFLPCNRTASCPCTTSISALTKLCTIEFRDIETTFLTQPACFYAHTDEASTQPASVVSINH